MPMPASTNVAITGFVSTPATTIPQSMNNILFLTKEQPLITATDASPYKVYGDVSGVKKDYGSTSNTYLMAQTMFSQSPNFKFGNGQLTIAPLLSSTDATYGQFATQQITNTIVTNFQGVSNGGFKITTLTGGTTYEIDGLNFTGVSTEADIVKIIGESVASVPFSQFATVREATSATPSPIIFGSKVPGLLSAITLSSPSSVGTVVDLTGALYFNVTSGAGVPGANSSGESLSDAFTRLMRLNNKPNFSAVITNKILESTAVLSFSSFIQYGNEDEPYQFGYGFYSVEDLRQTDGVCAKIVELGYTKTRMVFDFNNDPLLFCAGYNALLRSVNVNTINSATNAIPNLSKKLAGISSSTISNDQLENQVLPAGVDMYLNVAGSPGIARPSSANGGQFNTIYFSDEILLQLQNDLIALLSTQSVTASPVGDSILESTIRQTLLKIVSCGMVVEGNWYSAVPPGVPNNQAFKDQIAKYGFYIYVQPYTNRTAQDILQGKTPPILVACNLVGGINVVVVNVYSQQG